ncbi:unnamed protein product [Lactuca virosa]|uniref:Uncharacterized protein n=1 Tax=Lactuca virosa TaxID=75947 RepID=A0AAU9MKU6_9ASTR|nr:unnamed protein product [Lactuca virosa]
MVRNIPTSKTPTNNPLLSRSFIFAFILSTITIISLLCAKKKKKRAPPLNNPARKISENTKLLVSTTNKRTSEVAHVKTEDKTGNPPPLEPPTPQQKELPPPPRLASIRASSYHVGPSSNTSHGAKLTSSMSMRLSGRLKGLKKGSKKENDNGKDKEYDTDKLQREDSVWKKRIILGEKCRVPDEDEDDIIYDEHGMRITTFHGKQSGLSISRQSSDASQNVIHIQNQNR